jgi:hypothetical protein
MRYRDYRAGGNDPFLPMSGPLPPHSPVGRIVLERDPLLPYCKRVALRRALIRHQHPCVFNHLVAAARIQFLPRSPIREETSRTGTHSIFFGRASGFVRLRYPHFSCTIAIGTCSTSRAAA